MSIPVRFCRLQTGTNYSSSYSFLCLHRTAPFHVEGRRARRRRECLFLLECVEKLPVRLLSGFLLTQPPRASCSWRHR